MNNQEIISFLSQLDLRVYKHASNIKVKFEKFEELKPAQKIALPIIFEKYKTFLNENISLIGFEDSIITRRTELLNDYYNFIKENKYDNIFTSQGKFRPTIIEEFMYILFRDLVEQYKSNINSGINELKLGSIKAYTNLFYSSTNFLDFIQSPKIGINVKDQDFAIYRPVNISSGTSNETANLPIISIETKTYIDKTMLDGSISTAEKIKSGNPYSLYILVAERYAVDLNVDPVYSKIDQIYILRKDNNKDTLNPVYSDVLIDLVKFVNNHLTRNWSNVEHKLLNTGKLI